MSRASFSILSFRTHDVWDKYRLDDVVLAPLQVVRQTMWPGTGRGFNIRYAHIEIHWCKDIAQTIFLRGYNTLGDRSNSRSQIKATHKRKAELAAHAPPQWV